MIKKYIGGKTKTLDYIAKCKNKEYLWDLEIKAIDYYKTYFALINEELEKTIKLLEKNSLKYSEARYRIINRKIKYVSHLRESSNYASNIINRANYIRILLL